MLIELQFSGTKKRLYTHTVNVVYICVTSVQWMCSGKNLGAARHIQRNVFETGRIVCDFWYLSSFYATKWQRSVNHWNVWCNAPDSNYSCTSLWDSDNTSSNSVMKSAVHGPEIRARVCVCLYNIFIHRSSPIGFLLQGIILPSYPYLKCRFRKQKRYVGGEGEESCGQLCIIHM